MKDEAITIYFDDNYNRSKESRPNRINLSRNLKVLKQSLSKFKEEKISFECLFSGCNKTFEHYSKWNTHYFYHVNIYERLKN